MKFKHSNLFLAAASIIYITLASPSVHAADLLWGPNLGAGPWDWNTGSNWTGGTAPTIAADRADLRKDWTAAAVINLSAPTITNGILFDDTGATSDVGLTIGNGGVTGNTLTLAGTAPEINVTGTLGISAVIAGNTNWTKTGGGTLTLSGANTYSGTTTVSHTTATTVGIVVANASALGTGDVLVNGRQSFGNAGLSVNAGLTVTNSLTLRRGQGGSNRANLGLGAGSDWNGNITVDNTSGSGLAAIVAGGGNSANSSIVSGNIGFSTLGSGLALVLRGGGTFGKVSGSVSLSTGTVQIAEDSKWEFSNASNTWGMLELTNANGIVTTGAANTLSSTGVVTSSAGGTLQLNNQVGTTAYSQTIAGLGGNVKVGLTTGTSTLTLNTTTNQTSSGVISGAISLVKSGSATQTLTGVNTYSGDTIIKSGSLKLDVAGNLSSSQNIIIGDAGSSGTVLDVTTKTTGFTVEASQTLGGIGHLNAAGKTVTINGGLTPGNGPGKLNVTTTGLSFGAGSVLGAELTRGVTPSAGVNYDQLDVAGGIVIDPTAIFSPSTLGSGGWNVNDLFFIMLNDGIDPITGTFSGYADGSTFLLGSQSFMLTYQGDSGSNSFTGGNDLAVMVIPEPASALLGGLGLLILLRRRR